MRIAAQSIKRTRTVLQFEAAECGAASLSIILSYFGKWVALSELRVKMGVTRDGTSVLQLRDTAIHYGLRVKASRYLPGALELLHFPLICHWENAHFVVVEGVKNGKCYISDPALGRYKTSIDNFYRSTPTRIILEFDTTSDFVLSGNPPGVLKSVLDKIHPFRQEILYLVLLSAMSTVPTIGLASVGSVLINNVLIQQQFALTNGLILLSGILLFVFVALSGFQSKLYRAIRVALSRYESVKFMTRLLSLPIPFFETRHGSELTHRVGLNDSIAETIAGESGQSIILLTSSLVYASILLLVCWPLALGCFFIQAVQIAILLGSREDRNDHSRVLSQSQGQLFSNTFDSLRSIETIKASGLEDQMYRRWVGLHARYTNSFQAISLTTSRINTATRFLNDLLTCTILIAGGLLVINGLLSIGWLISFRLIYDSFSQPLVRLAATWSEIESLVGDIAKVDDALKEKPDNLASLTSAIDDTNSNLRKSTSPPITPESQPTILSTGTRNTANSSALRVDIKNLSFSYGSSDKLVLQSVDLAILENQRVCFVGSTGCGKSTLLRIIAGVYTPTSGVIEISGEKLSSVNSRQLHSDISYITQRSELVEGTILENITLFDSGYPEEEVAKAAALACIDRDISLLPDGYQTHVGGSEFRFSGGQRQRINIARAILRKPKLLLMDEATSALDSETESIVSHNIRDIGCTQIVVAHRLNTIIEADRIHYLLDGRIVESGSHTELMNYGGKYAQQYLAASR